jgi:uncharacterized protein YhaN
VAGASFHGRNAAGKSTTLRAVLDLLFGIPDRSTDGFAHGNKALRIGARLVTADGRTTLEVERRKGRKDTLRDPLTGRPVAEALLATMLGGIGRDQFAATFGLDHERLRQGAQDLLATGGALGATLFDASNNCNADGFACLLGAPLTATQLSECSAGVKRIAALTSNDFVRAKRMAVATIASSNFLCD